MLPRPWQLIFFPTNAQAQERVDGDYVELYLSSVLSENSDIKESLQRGFPFDAVVKNLPANAEDTGSGPGPGRSHMLQSN